MEKGRITNTIKEDIDKVVAKKTEKLSIPRVLKNNIHRKSINDDFGTAPTTSHVTRLKLSKSFLDSQF